MSTKTKKTIAGQWDAFKIHPDIESGKREPTPEELKEWRADKFAYSYAMAPRVDQLIYDALPEDGQSDTEYMLYETQVYLYDGDWPKREAIPGKGKGLGKALGYIAYDHAQYLPRRDKPYYFYEIFLRFFLGECMTFCRRNGAKRYRRKVFHGKSLECRLKRKAILAIHKEIKRRAAEKAKKEEPFEG